MEGTAEQPRLLRYEIVPASCVIRNVVVRLYGETPSLGAGDGSNGQLWCGSGSAKGEGGAVSSKGQDQAICKGEASSPEVGVVIDASFGFIVNGQDCLKSVVFVDPVTSERSDPLATDLHDGRWSMHGYYYLLPYRSKMKPYEAGGDPSAASSAALPVHKA